MSLELFLNIFNQFLSEYQYVKVITIEACVPKHKLLVMDMWFKATKRRRRKFEPRVRVWKLKEDKTCEEFRYMVGDKVEEVKWKGLGVNDHWQQMYERYNDGNSSGHTWNDKRTTQTQGNVVVERGGCGSS